MGVEIVRQLRGVQLRDDAPRAILVSASSFTAGAKREAADLVPARLGYSMELVTISDLLAELGLTDEPLASVMATDRDRSSFRRWFRNTFKVTDTEGRTSNPTVRNGGPKSMVLGWWRLSD